MGKQLFGTDGIRGRAGEYPLDGATVFATGRALAQRLGGRGRVLIGMDTRRSSGEIAGWLAAGLAHDGVGADSVGVLPTAGVSLLTDRGDYVAGVMISASHNPYQDNGIKVFGREGFKLPDAEEHEVEQLIFDLREEQAAPAGVDVEVDQRQRRNYLDHLIAAGSSDLKPLRLVVDCSNGAASDVAAEFFAALGMDAELMADQPDGVNINRDCGSTHLHLLREKVLERGADLGIAFDGDADRALFIADDGGEIDGDVILLLGGQFLHQRGGLPDGRVVTTVMANMGLEKSLREAGIEMVRTQVGDKYVLEEMVSGGSALGGEQSGHIILKQFANTGDGLLTARLMLEILSESGEPMSKLRRRLEVFPQKLVNVPVARKPPIEDEPKLARAVEAATRQMGDRGRILVRYSGTEPLARVMVEAQDPADVERHCRELAEVFEQTIGLSRESQSA